MKARIKKIEYGNGRCEYVVQTKEELTYNFNTSGVIIAVLLWWIVFPHLIKLTSWKDRKSFVTPEDAKNEMCQLLAISIAKKHNSERKEAEAKAKAKQEYEANKIKSITYIK